MTELLENVFQSRDVKTNISISDGSICTHLFFPAVHISHRNYQLTIGYDDSPGMIQ